MLTDGKKVAALGVLVTLVVAGCNPAEAEDVATLSDNAGDDASPSVGGYANAATAAYAGCLDQHDLPVAPLVESSDPEDFVPPASVGYAEIDGAVFLSGGPDGPSKDFDYTIGIDGADRTEAIRECYESNPGAKDAMLDSNDDPGITEEWTPPEEAVNASLQWARCARDAGVSIIEDPGPDGYVIIPEDLELAEAQMLGKECSAPVAQQDDLPMFQYHAAVEDPASGLMDIGPYNEAIEAPFHEMMCAEHPDQCSDSD